MDMTVAEEKVQADFEVRHKAKAEVRAREKAKSLVAGEVMQARLGLGVKPKVHNWLLLLDFTDLLPD